MVRNIRFNCNWLMLPGVITSKVQEGRYKVAAQSGLEPTQQVN